MKELISLSIIIGCSFIFSRLIRGHTRDMLTPWVLAGLAVWGGLMPFGTGRIMLFGTIYYYLAMGFLTDGFKLSVMRKNPALHLFLWFWGYMLFSMLFYKDGIVGVRYFALCLFEMISVGYFVGLYVLRVPDGLWKVARAFAILSTVITIVYIRGGALSGGLDVSERIGLQDAAEEKASAANVNWIGLSMVSFLPMLFLAILGKGASGWFTLLYKGFAVFNFLAMGAIVLRTGSRNSTLAFLPMLFFALTYRGMGKRSNALRHIKILMLAFVAIGGIFVLVKRLNKGTGVSVGEMRAFDYRQENVSSGRIDYFIELNKRMGPLGRIVGAGPHLDYQFARHPSVGNGHSAHFQLYYQSGLVGLLLYIPLIVMILFSNRHDKQRRSLMLLFFFVWFLTGLGESANIMRGLIGAKLYLGMALAFCSKLRFSLPFRKLPTRHM